MGEAEWVGGQRAITGLQDYTLNYVPHWGNARKSIGLQILIIGDAELQIALPFGQRPLVRQNRLVPVFTCRRNVRRQKAR